MNDFLICWSCKEEIEIGDKITRQDTCPNCDNPVKCCFNCLHYDKEAYHQCSESAVAEWVRYKEKANFCEYFRPRLPRLEKATGKPTTPEEKKKAWDQLFED
jgi:hypothetical protein